MRSTAIAAFIHGSRAVLGIAALISLSPVTAGAGSGAAANTVLKASTSPAQVNVSTAHIQPVASALVQLPPSKGVGGGQSSASSTESSTNGLDLLTPAQRRVYRRAASSFTSFCHHWESLLHEREVDNLGHLSWHKDGGLETATYTGYGKVESCECKPSKEGLPIGRIRYEERNYSIVGRTIEEARHAAPKLTHEISTLEIFSWDKGKWFY